jgi:putative copper resistance protein D
MTPDAALVLVRFVHFAAVAIAFGTVLFRVIIAGPSFAATLSPRLLHWERWALGAGLATLVAWFFLEAAVAGEGWASAGDPGTLGSLLTDTAFGHSWLFRTVTGLACGALLATERGRRLPALVALGLFTLSLGSVGHGVMLDGAIGYLLMGSMALHALGAAAWLGALPGLCLALSPGKGDIAAPEAIRLLYRFSAVGHAAVASVYLTGLVQSRLINGDWLPLGGSAYDGFLGIKIVLAVLMGVLALINRYVLLPNAGSQAIGRIRRSAILEVVLGIGVLALAAQIGMMSPME